MTDKKEWHHGLFKQTQTKIEEAEIIDDDFDFLDRPSEEGTAAQDRKPQEVINIQHCQSREDTNQALGHTKNPGLILSDNFYHRMIYECLLTRALINLDVFFAVAPVWCEGKSRKRREPDAMILAYQNLGAIELNGKSHDDELADDRDGRMERFRDQLVYVKYYKVPEQPDLHWATGVVKDFLRRLKDRKTFQMARWDPSLLLPNSTDLGGHHE